MIRIFRVVMSGHCRGGIGSSVSRWGFGVFMPHAPAICAAIRVWWARAELTWDQSGLLVRFAAITRMSGGCLCFLYYLGCSVRLTS